MLMLALPPLVPMLASEVPLNILLALSPVTVLAFPNKYAPVTLPAALINPPVRIFPPVTLPVAETLAGVNEPTTNDPLAITLPPVILPEADMPVVPSNESAMLSYP
jgi:hypothetical protein